MEESRGSGLVADGQEILVRHLAEQIRALLAGDADERRRIEHRKPSKVLQLGVLPPRLVMPDSDETSEELARRWGYPPSSLGLEWLALPSETGALSFEAECDFSIYVQRYPSWDEQREWVGGLDGVRDEDDDDSEMPEGTVRLKGIYERVDIRIPRTSFSLGDNEAPGFVEMSLDEHIEAQAGDELVSTATVFPFEGTQTLPLAALASEAAWLDAIRVAEGSSRSNPHSQPAASLRVAWQPDREGAVRVRLTLTNEAVAIWGGGGRRGRREKKPPGEPHLFNAKVRVFEREGAFKRTDFVQAPEDFRYQHLRSVWVTGQNCVGRRLESEEHPERPLASDTWPIYRQVRVVPSQAVDLRVGFAELANEETCLAALGRVLAGMRRFEGAWVSALESWPDVSSSAECSRALDGFREDIRTFELGIRCLGEDERLALAFREANRVFERQGLTRRSPIDGWRLFQVVFQVVHLAALRARETDSEELRAELDVVDVLWFPTGGGKTEAYLGLIATLLFYDRLRGKQRGVSAMLRFPLRMLSVQQLQRILSIVWFAERRRLELVDAGVSLEGDSFSLGYWVGRGKSSPNTLVDSRIADNPRENVGWWAEYLRDVPREESNKDRIITSCPNPSCVGGQVELEADVSQVRLRHVCRVCGETLPVVVSDDEVYRYLPAVLVCTVDKLAHVARARQFTSVVAGPLYQCPLHGYFYWHEAVFGDGPMPTRNDRCIAGSFCDVPAADYTLVPPTHDPGPALQVQDELHLLEEELGTFNAHYETLMEEIERAHGSHLPAKLLAATATIEAYSEQVRQLYARRGRVFPSLGWQLGESFYTEGTAEARRLYVGALPYRPDVAEFGEKVQGAFHTLVSKMQDDPTSGLEELRRKGLDERLDASWLLGELLNYELTLGYVNQKRDADRIQYGLRQLHRIGALPDELRVQVLTSENTLAEIAGALDEIESQTSAVPRHERLRALVATSIVSHGVDIDMLNLMVMNGMTPAVADYIQATSRSGRTHVGLVVVGYDRRKLRELSFYRYFLKYHEYLDRLIAPVPVNRFAKFASNRTVPGILSALFLHIYGPQRGMTDGAVPDPGRPRLRSLAIAAELRRWWLGAEPPADKARDVSERTLKALGVGKRVLVRAPNGSVDARALFDPGMEEALRSDAEDEVARQLTFVQQPQTGTTANIFHPEPLTSFRTVDIPLEFGVSSAAGERIESALIGSASSSGGPSR